MEDGTPIMVRGTPLQEDCVTIPVICKTENKVKLPACNWGRIPLLIRQKWRIAHTFPMQEMDMEPFRNLDKGLNVKQSNG